jgi:ATP-dependent DNA helicase RecG
MKITRRGLAEQLSLLEILERPTIEALFKPDALFAVEDAEFLRTLPEDTRFERKSAKVTGVALATLLSAFGNGPAVEGGVIAIGIADDGKIEGCKSLSDARRAEIETAGRDRCPDGRFTSRRIEARNAQGEDDFIVILRVHFVETRLVECTDGNAYCREGDSTRRLTEAEKQEFRINKGERAFELEPCPLIYPDDFRSEEITRFARQIRESRGGSDSISDLEIMQSMRMGKIKGNSFVPNNVCALMFARDPQTVFPGSYVHFLRYNGTEEKTGSEYNVIKDRMIGGTILEIIRDASSAIDSNLREFTEFRDGKFYPYPEYPRDAWYELVVNACVHRSYHDKNTPVFVKMFDDRFVVQSPGAFMPQVTPDNLFHKPRNPFLMFALREFGEVRVIGEGTQRIKREMIDAKLPAPRFQGSNHAVTASLFNSIANRTNSLDSEAYKVLGEALSFSLDPDERRLVNFAIENGSIKPTDALRVLTTTYWQTARAKLQRLVDRGILDFHSSKKRDPNSFYTLRKGPSNGGIH